MLWLTVTASSIVSDAAVPPPEEEFEEVESFEDEVCCLHCKSPFFSRFLGMISNQQVTRIVLNFPNPFRWCWICIRCWHYRPQYPRWDPPLALPMGLPTFPGLLDQMTASPVRTHSIMMVWCVHFGLIEVLWACVLHLLPPELNSSQRSTGSNSSWWSAGSKGSTRQNGTKVCLFW